MAFTNVSQFSALGVSHTWWATLSSDGTPNGTSATALANGSAAGMGRLKGVTAISLAIPEAPRLPYVGDNSVMGQFLGMPQSMPEGTITTTISDLTFDTVANGVKLYSDGVWDEAPVFPLCYVFDEICMVLNSPAQNQEFGNVGSAGWQVVEINNALVHMEPVAEMATNAVQEFTGQISLNRSSKWLTGATISSTNYGSTQFAMRVYTSLYPVTLHKYVGNNATTTVTLDETPAAADANYITVYKNGTKLTYTTDFSVNTTTKVVTFVAAPAAADSVVVKYCYTPVC